MFSDFKIFYNIFIIYITADKIIINLTNAINIRYRRDVKACNPWYVILRKNISIFFQQ